MIAALAGALSAVIQGKQMHGDDDEHPHWRALGLLCIIIGVAAVLWLIHKHHGRLFA